MSDPMEQSEVILGVDTHLEVHVAVLIDVVGRVTVQTDAGELVIRHQDREVARHPVLAGKHQMRILPEHGPGALARNRRQRIAQPQARLLNRWFGPPEVEVRDLAAYDEVSV